MLLVRGRVRYSSRNLKDPPEQGAAHMACTETSVRKSAELDCVHVVIVNFSENVVSKWEYVQGGLNPTTTSGVVLI